MLVYYGLYTLIFAVCIYTKIALDPKNEILSNKIFCAFSACCIIVLMCLRHPSMGIDLGYMKETGYLQSFDYLSKLSWKSIFQMKSFKNYEFGFVVFNKVVGSIWCNRQFFLVCCAIISLAPIFYVIYKDSKIPLMSIIIYLGLPCFLICFSALRQAIAVSIIFFSIRFIRQKRWLWFVVLVLLATTFHSSAIVFLIAYPVYYIKQNDISVMFSVATLPIVYVFRDPIFSVLSKIFKKDAMPDNNGSVTLFLVFCAIYICMAFFRDREDAETGGYFNLFYIACVIQAFSGIYSTALRVGYYFMIFLPLLIPKIIAKLKIDRTGYFIVCGVILIGFTAFGLYSLYSTYWTVSFPYIFFWQKVSVVV